MKRTLLLICTLSISLTIFAKNTELILVWETSGFSNPESVIYDEKRERLYVSNVNGSPVEKDGSGTISLVSLNGEIIEPAWIIGLNAPKGLTIHNDKLYVADIDTLVEIDISSRSITNTYTVPDAKFLNDVSASPDGEIFVSDMILNRIHRLSNNKFDIWLESPDLESPNGLLAKKEVLVVGSWGVMTDGFATEVPGHLKQISYKDKTIESIGSNKPIGNLDGVEIDKNGHYYVTDWMNGKLFHIHNDGTIDELLELNQGSADHEYIASKDLILIPMMKDNKLLAYKTRH